jgi:hypothetical protein
MSLPPIPSVAPPVGKNILGQNRMLFWKLPSLRKLLLEQAALLEQSSIKERNDKIS